MEGEAKVQKMYSGIATSPSSLLVPQNFELLLIYTIDIAWVGLKQNFNLVLKFYIIFQFCL